MTKLTLRPLKLTLRPQPRLHPESWRELRQLWKLHGRNQLVDALNWLDEQEYFERQRMKREAVVTKTTVWEK